MIRLGGIVELQAIGKPGQVVSNPFVRAFTPIKEDSKLEEKVDMEELEMMLKKLKKENPGKKVTYSFIKGNQYPKGYVIKINGKILEGEDHEVSMAQSSLDSIIKYANDLKGQLGNMEKNIPAWIQDHISKSENYIQQAANFYHEYESVQPIEEGRGLKTISKDLDKVLTLMQQHLELYKKSKGTSEEKKHIEHLKKLTKQKNDLTKEMNAKVSDMHKNAELKIDESLKK